MIKIYNFDTSRNKSKYKNRSVNSLKKQIYSEKGNKCYLCKKELELKYLQLEHKIPIEIGGLIFDKSNLELCCIKCHHKKTLIDLKVIKLIKNLKIISHKGMSFFSLEELRKKYTEFFNLLFSCEENYKIWYGGVIGIDYDQIIDNSNREGDLDGST